ncbi:MAG: hypothetical protein ACLRSW_04580 [Christensenellaceae bacterium]
MRAAERSAPISATRVLSPIWDCTTRHALGVGMLKSDYNELVNGLTAYYSSIFSLPTTA